MIQDCIKYIAVAKQRILCIKGWILQSNLKENQIRLFPTPAHIEQFFENKIIKPKYQTRKVKVRIEVLGDE